MPEGRFRPGIDPLQRLRSGPRLRHCWLILLLCLFWTPVPADTETEQQRQRFKDAKQALHDGRLERYRALAAELQDYPLYPYLVYDYLRPRLWKLDEAEIADFLERFGDVPLARNIRRSWLKLLARRGHWQTFLQHYADVGDTSLQCYQLQARIETGGDERLLEDTRKLWLVGESQPPQCDPAFERLYDSELMTSALLWERIGLVMAEGHTRLADYLGRKLDSGERVWVKRWIAMHHNPYRGTRRVKYEDHVRARQILVHGLRRLARRDTDAAIRRWERLRARFDFSREQYLKTQRTLAVYAIINEHQDAKRLLDSFAREDVDEGLFQWRLRLALDSGDWPALVTWTAGPPPEDERLRLRWQYWRARALEHIGAEEQARDLYRSLARERDYYGFLAADRLGVSYNLNHASLAREQIQPEQLLARTPALRRARELYALDMTYSARREWYYMLQDMNPAEMRAAARLAFEWGWHDRTILTLGKAAAFDDLELRFPLPHQTLLEKYAAKRGLDLSWIYALTRAESAFMPDARSPAGALGLMQVMPATGRRTARGIGFRSFRTNYLLRADHNVTIGTAYLKQMYDKFENNKILATAAYNAGPHNVTRWLPESECREPDIWIETIPFTETRKYVARILYYASIYDWRLRQDISPVRERMALIQPRRDNLVTAINCAVANLTQN